MKVPLTYGERTEASRIGYARCSTDRQARELRRLYDTGDYSISDLAQARARGTTFATEPKIAFSAVQFPPPRY